MRYWGLWITFCDEENNQFLTLGGAAFNTKRERDANFDRIPPSGTDSPFIIDVEDDSGIVDDRLVDEKTVESLLGKPASEAIRQAREQAVLGYQEQDKGGLSVQTQIESRSGDEPVYHHEG